ncbi:PilN domain-containing protein [Candidatus Cyanaurora vandensis]|uniref:PilN domain-containing protein n=1 Tax=Candidatus Cyanaurora vandensis TaxID=2714958 RepID=UPI00257D481D|nr:PilN domain-containing protein [Candidatus Cyanaurora vandensis]
MYVPEINFLKDRTTEGVAEPLVSESFESEGGLDPLIVAVVLPVAALGLVAAVTLFFNSQIGSKTDELAALNSQIGVVQAEVASLKSQEKELQEYQNRSQAVINLFDLSRPWSAVLEDLRRRVPSSVWLENFTAKENAVQISGRALDYTQVAAFQLTLADSPFVEAVELEDTSQQAATAESPATVSYKLNLKLKQQGIGQFATVLEEAGSIGLLEKLRRLQKENLIQ